eukprot:scaffold53574_cov46-Phaeocystis_antarctica.AAC.5
MSVAADPRASGAPSGPSKPRTWRPRARFGRGLGARAPRPERRAQVRDASGREARGCPGRRRSGLGRARSDQGQPGQQQAEVHHAGAHAHCLPQPPYGSGLRLAMPRYCAVAWPLWPARATRGQKPNLIRICAVTLTLTLTLALTLTLTLDQPEPPAGTPAVGTAVPTEAKRGEAYPVGPLLAAEAEAAAGEAAGKRGGERGTRNTAQEPKALGTTAVGARKTVVLMSLVQSLLFSGITFGWPSFSMLLQQDGAFLDERCHAECRKLAPPLSRRRLLWLFAALKALAVAASSALTSCHSAKFLHPGATRRGSTCSTPAACSSSRPRSQCSTRWPRRSSSSPYCWVASCSTAAARRAPRPSPASPSPRALQWSRAATTTSSRSPSHWWVAVARLPTRRR